MSGRRDEATSLMGFPEGLDGQVERFARQRFRLCQPALPRQFRGQLVHLVGDPRMAGSGRRQADRQCTAEERFRFGVAAAAQQPSEAVQAVEQPYAVIAEVAADEIDAVPIQPFRSFVVTLDVADVIRQVNHGVAGDVMLTPERGQGDGEGLAPRGDGFGEASLPAQVGRQCLQDQ